MMMSGSEVGLMLFSDYLIAITRDTRAKEMEHQSLAIAIVRTNYQ
jgi:hypothetical protein